MCEANIDSVNDTVIIWLAKGSAMKKIQDYQSFWGTAAELSQAAGECARLVGFDAGKLNERLVRYYTAEGIINRPDRLGREAAYNYLHLLQLVVARRMGQGGAPLAAIRSHNEQASAEQLERSLDANLNEEVHTALEKVVGLNAGAARLKLPLLEKVSKADTSGMESNAALRIEVALRVILAELEKTDHNIEKLRSTNIWEDSGAEIRLLKIEMRLDDLAQRINDVLQQNTDTLRDLTAVLMEQRYRHEAEFAQMREQLHQLIRQPNNGGGI